MKQITRDILFNPLFNSIYKYRYIEKKSDGTYTITYSKNPILKPSLVDRAKLKKYVTGKQVYQIFFDEFINDKEVKQ